MIIWELKRFENYYFDENYRSIRSLSFNKNFSLSCPSIVTSRWIRFFLSGNPRLFISISLAWPFSSVRMPLCIRRNVGSFSRAAHFRASSSSSSRDDLEKTSTELFLSMLEAVIRPLVTLLISLLSIGTNLFHSTDCLVNEF